MRKKKPEPPRAAKPPEVVGTCPRCGLPVLALGSVYSCSSNAWDCEQRRPIGCGFTVHKLFLRHSVSTEEMRRLLADRTTGPSGPFVSAGGRPFFSAIVLEDGGQTALRNIEFADGA